MSEVNPEAVPFTRKSPYQFYIEENYDTVKAANPSADHQQLMIILATQHANTTVQQRSVFVQKALDREPIDKQIREVKIVEFKAAETARKAEEAAKTVAKGPLSREQRIAELKARYNIK